MIVIVNWFTIVGKIKRHVNPLLMHEKPVITSQVILKDSTALQILNANYKYIAGADALKNVNVTVPRNEVFGLLGSNGSGKTTMVNCLAGIIKPDRGQAVIRHGGINVDLFDMSQISHLFSIVPQLDLFWPNLTVREHMQIFEKINTRKIDSKSLLSTTKLQDYEHVQA